MRINLYEEELTDEVRVVHKVAENTGITYYGTRFYLESAPSLHATDDDDDRSAVTFWFGSHELCRTFADRCGRLLQNPLDHLTQETTESTERNHSNA
jgi:hypothetical protein